MAPFKNSLNQSKARDFGVSIYPDLKVKVGARDIP